MVIGLPYLIDYATAEEIPRAVRMALSIGAPALLAGLSLYVLIGPLMGFADKRSRTQVDTIDRLAELEDAKRQAAWRQTLAGKTYAACARATTRYPAGNVAASAYSSTERSRKAARDSPQELDSGTEMLTRWRRGDRDTELALRLLFHAWDCQEPGDLLPWEETDPVEVFREVFTALGGSESDNAEFLFAAGNMIVLFPYRTGLDEDHGNACLRRFLKICPQGIPQQQFEGRGEFGDHFADAIDKLGH